MEKKVNIAPVFLMFFIRPHTLERVFEAVKKAKPSTLFLVSDGPREGNPNDKRLNDMCKNIVENIDWECDVHRLYSNVNKGMFKTYYDAFELAFKVVDSLIFLEDDILPNQSFFRFCSDLLVEYQDDVRIHMICGMNHLGIYSEPKSDYFFSKAGSIWGFAIWKRTYESFIYDMDYANDQYILDLLEIISSNTYFNIKANKFINGNLSENDRIAFEFQSGLSMHLQNRLLIVPKKNMIHSLGATEGSAHAPNEIKKLPKRLQSIFCMETYDYDFPLQHPKYIIEDRKYEKKVLQKMGKNSLVASRIQRIEGIIRSIYYGDGKILLKKFFSRIM